MMKNKPKGTIIAIAVFIGLTLLCSLSAGKKPVAVTTTPPTIIPPKETLGPKETALPTEGIVLEKSPTVTLWVQNKSPTTSLESTKEPNQPVVKGGWEWFTGKDKQERIGQLVAGQRVKIVSTDGGFVEVAFSSWIENADVKSGNKMTTCTKHDWGHLGPGMQCHAHLLDSSGGTEIIGVLMPDTPIKVLETVGGRSRIELSQPAWFSREQIQ